MLKDNMTNKTKGMGSDSDSDSDSDGGLKILPWTKKLVRHSFNIEYKKNSAGEYKKKLKGMADEWQKLRESKIHQSHTASGCLTGEVNGRRPPRCS